MKTIIEVISHTGETNASYHICEKFPVKIGRGFDNDVILTDPYVDDSHLEIIAGNAGGWVVRDLGTINGTMINKRHLKDAAVKSGEKINLGMTEIRILSQEHKVVPAIKLEQKNSLIALIEKPYSALVSLFAAFAVMQLWAYFEIWTDERQVVTAATAAGALGIVMLWSALWSVASRITINKTNFARHMTVISLYLIFSVGVWYLLSYTNYLANENLFAAVVNYIVNFTSITLLIYTSLCFTNAMNEKKRLITSALFAFGVVSGIFVLNYINNQQFSLEPHYASGMEPYLSQFAPSITVEEFALKNEALFSSETFDEKQ